MAFSPDGKLLASGGFGEMAIHLWEPSTGRQLRLLTGHSGGIGTFSSGVTALEFSPDSRLLAAGYSDSSMGIWDVVTGDEVLATPGGGNKLVAMAGVRAIAFSSDGRLLASADSGSTKVWDLSTGGQKQEVQLPLTDSLLISDFAFTHDGRELVTLSRQTSGTQVIRNAPAQIKTSIIVHFTDIETGQENRTVVLTGEIPQTILGRHVATPLDGRVLFLTVAGDSVNISDVTSKSQPRILNYKPEARTGAFADAQFLSANARLVAFTHGNHVSVWDVERRSELYGVDVEKSATYEMGMPSSIMFSADSKWLAIGNYDGSIRILEAPSGHESSLLIGPVNLARSLSFSANGDLLFSGAKTKWNLGSGRGEALLATASGNTGSVSPKGRLLAEPSQSGADVRVWDIDHRASLPTLAVASESLPNLIAFSPDEKLLAVTYRQSASQIVALNANAQAAIGQRPTINKDKKNARAAAMAEVQRQIAEAQTLSQTPQVEEVYKETKIWDITSGQQLQSLPTGAAHTYGTTESIAFSPDGKSLATAESGVIKIWDVHTGQALGTITPGNSGATTSPMTAAYPSMGSLCYSPDGKYLAVAEKITINNAQQALAKMQDAMRNGSFPSAFTVPKRSKFGGIFTQVRPPSSGKANAQTMASIRSALPAAADMEFQVSGPVEIWNVTSRERVISLAGHESGTTLVSYSSDGKVLATSGPDDDIKLWDLSTGNEMRTLSGHTATINAMAFSPRGDYLASASADGMTRLWDVGSGEFLATLMSLYDGRDWLVITPDGLFDGSPAAWNEILWRFDNNTFDVVPVESFFNEYYYPDLLADILRGKRPRARQDLEKKDRRQPQISLEVPGSQSGRLTNTRLIHVTVKIQNAAAGARDVRLFRNGSLVKFWHGDVLGGKQDAILETEIPIVAGTNHLTAYAFNADNIKSVDGSLEVTGAPSLDRKPTAYILSVGINEYSNPDYNLRFAAADAAGFSAELKRQLEKQQRFASVEVTSLNDRDATKSSILAAFKDLALRAQPEDEVFVFVASHGTAAQDHFYLIPSDLGYSGSRTQLDEQAVTTILDHSISDQELEKTFEGLDVARLLLVIDACNSGQALEAEEKRRGPMNSKGLAQLAYEKGMYVLTASQSFQAAQEVSKIGHGLLTYALIVEGLEKGLADFEPKDGQVVIREWLDYASLRVPEVQVEELKQARSAGRSLSFGVETRDVREGTNSAQQPKLFYRRDIESNAWVISNPQ
jgi:WD40 repeat protein